ncbi:hypothetical protein JX265_008268 [Neoarthrinium moseri]|uniref:SMP-LTD domain-containing protein n=1 Tax=Neoarthrinium moseri TaxID=1658444 RepID=A0A9Q0ANS9_9PEZI|nr:hypothetical protein JX265_008268 [Neoarthrinium moseri]
MGSWTAFLLTYLLGGVTFIPIVLVTAWFALPQVRELLAEKEVDGGSIVRPGDLTKDLEAAQKAEKGESKPQYVQAADVAAGYFAVCRDYTPMGINAKPIERSTPVGSATVAAPSQSVYQAMYRTIFDRKQGPNPLENTSGNSVRPKRAGNVFYVVLRHGHLMLFDDDEQLEVRHVISLAHHDVSIYSGGDSTPEGELFIKRNALCLSRKLDSNELAPDSQISRPFYLFCENCSAKEDFYFALIRNQEQVFGATNRAPQPLQFEVKNIISLVQRLHSSEEHMQTRWLNAMIGRIFLGIHRTKDIENLIREKITKKISRVKRPTILSRIAIQNIDTGDSAPYITNPRLKDLTVEGEFGMEADVKYTGNFRLEVAATARIDLGTRFKVREVNLVLAVVLKKLEGHVFFKIKPPPSNRIWFSFQTMPKMEMTIEPIVSTRQITYTVILRQIENRIKEVVAETLVQPFWDDMPFFKTEHKEWRGGIFEGDDAVEHSEDHEEIAAMLGDVDEVSHIEETGIPTSPGSPELRPIEKSHSVPALENANPSGFWARKMNAKKTALQNQTSSSASASTTALDSKNSPSPIPIETPRPIRSGSYSASSPTISADAAHAELFKPSSSPPDKDDAASVMASVAARSRKGSNAPTPVGTPTRPTSVKQVSNESSSSESLEPVIHEDQTPTAPGRRDTTSSVDSGASESDRTDSPAPSTRASVRSATGSIGRGLFSRKDTSGSTTPNGTPDQKRNTLAAVSNAAATAKRWGWNAMQRRSEQGPDGRKLSDPPAVDLNQPMGRGQPLPPPGMPLPGPDRRSKVTPIPMPKRKPIPPPELAGRNSTTSVNDPKPERRAVPPPPLPRRRRVSEVHQDEGDEENLLVVEAPADSEPTSPLYEDHEHENSPAYVQPSVEDLAEGESGGPSTPSEGITEQMDTQDVPQSTVQHEDGSNDMKDVDEDDYANWLDNNPEFAGEEHEPIAAR